MEYKYARRMSEIKASEIRELLKLTEKPEVISFAGGLPAPELFPIEEIRAVNNYVLDRCGEQALQYTTTEGWQPLRKWIAIFKIPQGKPGAWSGGSRLPSCPQNTVSPLSRIILTENCGMRGTSYPPSSPSTAREA